MSRLFWIINAVVLVAALGLWVVGTRGIRGDVGNLKRDLDMEIDRIERLRKKLVNKSFVEVEREFKTHLEAEREKLKEVMRSRDLNIEGFDWGESPPPRGGNLADLRLWLEKQYSEKNELLAEAKIILPEGADQAKLRGEIKDWNKELTVRNTPEKLRELVVMREIHSALAEATAGVTFIVKIEGGKLRPEPKQRGVDELKSVEFGIRRPRGVIKRPPKVAPKVQALPYKEHAVTVTFVSHLNVVADVMRRVERSKTVLFVVRSVTLKCPEELTGPQAASVAGGVEKKHLRNTEDHEAPVETEITFGFFEFPVAREAREED